jgi:hypothetical protein
MSRKLLLKITFYYIKSFYHLLLHEINRVETLPTSLFISDGKRP